MSEEEVTYPLKVEMGKSWSEIKSSKSARILASICLVLVLAVLFSLQIMFQLKTQNHISGRIGDNSKYFAMKAKCQIQMDIKEFSGPYLIFYLRNGVARLYYHQHAESEEVTPDIIKRNGYYGGTIVPGWEQRFFFDDLRAYSGSNILTFSFVPVADCEPLFIHVPIPKNVTTCINDNIQVNSLDDEGNGCISIDGDFRGRGSIYALTRLNEQDVPDRLALIDEGVFVGNFEKEKYSFMFCNLDQNRDYTTYLTSVDGSCITNIKEYQFRTKNFTDEAKWGTDSVIFQRLEIPKTKQTGVNYRRWGGIDKEDTLFNDQLVTAGGVVLPFEAPDTDMSDVTDDPAIKWRKVKRRKNGKVIVRFLVLGKGEVYLYYEEGASKGKKMPVDQVISQGKNIGFADDELVSLNLSNPPEGAFTIYLSIVQPNKQFGPFDVFISKT